MLIYDSTKSEFMESIENDVIASQIQEKIFMRMGRKTSEAEYKSWENSLKYMYILLADEKIPNDSGVAIEYNLPQTSKRVDFIISGYNDFQEPNAVVIELKQWSEIKKVDGQDALVETFTGGANRIVVHPSYQVWSYSSLINDYNKNVQDKNIKLSPCVFLHNYQEIDNDPILDEQYKPYIVDAPVFTKGKIPQLRKFINNVIKKGDNKDIIYDIDSGEIRPSKSLQKTIRSMMRGNKEFTMIDEQKVVYENILSTILRCSSDKKKRTIIVEGGPGTGKSVIAINLLTELIRRGIFAQYVSKNSAPRSVYQVQLKKDFKKSSIDNLFKGSGVYTETDCNTVPALLVDEAHRLNAKSGMFKNKGENQIKEIIHSSLCSVFFIDESQRVTMDDIGSTEEIKKWALFEKSQVNHMSLTSQFRCNGSDGYLSWIDDVLEIKETGNYDLCNINYDIQIFDDPNEMKKRIFELNDINHKSRILAGYCWEWISIGKNDTNVHDIQIDDFSMSWNLGSSIFALDDTSINEVGCIHTSQGLEFDYVGIIIGEDMRYENSKIITDFTKRARTDQSIKGLKKLYKENPLEAESRAEEIIKNTYRTLMTRGMKGCYIYCVDKGLRDYLKFRISLGKNKI